MNLNIILSLYIITFVFYVLKEIIYIKKQNTIRLISTFRLMYAFVNGLLPAIIIYYFSSGDIEVVVYKEVFQQGFPIFYVWLISVIEYIVITITYENTSTDRTYYSPKSYSYYSIRRIIIFGIIVGLISLYLWTSAFGSISGMIVNANLVRANASEVYNPYAFLEHFARIFTILFFLSFASFLYLKKKRMRYKLAFVLMLITLFCDFLVMLCTDSRGEVAIVLIVATLYFLVFYKDDGKSILKRLLPVGIMLLSIFVLVILSEVVMNIIRGLDYEMEENSLLQTLVNEFGFTFSSQQMAFQYSMNNPFELLFTNDLINALFRWIPSRFIPFEMPQSIWDFNSDMLKSVEYFYGQAPSDFISTSLYSFGLLGVIVQPLYFGFILKKIETRFRKKFKSIFDNAIYGYFFFFSIWWVGYYSLATTVLSLFGVVVVTILLKIFSTKTTSYE